MKIDNFIYFVDNHDKLFRDYPNAFLVINNKSVVFSAKTMSEAIKWVDSNNLPDEIVQHCTSGTSAYSSSFCSQIIVK